MRSALARLCQVPGVHRVGLALAEGGGRRLLFAASDRDNQPSVDWCEVDAYEDVPLNHSVRTGEAVVGSLDDLARRYREFTDRQGSITQALASLPILAAGHVQGGYALFFDTPQLFDRSQVTELEELGAGLGADLRRVQRATTHASRSFADEPVPPGADVAIYSVVADPRAVAAARSFALKTLAAWGVEENRADAAIPCLSELVTNAIMHTDISATCAWCSPAACSPLPCAMAARPSWSTPTASRLIRSPCTVVGFRSWTRSRRGGARNWTRWE